MNAIDRDALREWARKRIEFYQRFDSDFAKGCIAGLNELIEKIQFGAFDIKPRESNGRMKHMTDTAQKIAEIREGYKSEPDDNFTYKKEVVEQDIRFLLSELDRKDEENRKLREERDKLIEALRWYADEDTHEIKRRVLGDFALISLDKGQRARDILREVGVTVE